MRVNGLIRVGWYHSHISSVALPSLRDVDVQYEMQMMSSTHPTVGLICGMSGVVTIFVHSRLFLQQNERRPAYTHYTVIKIKD